MAKSLELKYDSVELYSEETLGIGSYGKVCKAKCGQLPCAAKLLHDTLFQYSLDPGTHIFTRKFEEECQFLSTIKHPNIVQYLGTARDPLTRRLVLLMELMDESLTRYLERSTSTLSFHVQLNICYDVALALAYLHSNGIVHRDMSSNNVLLIGEASRAKVTDFGMFKLIDSNSRVTPLTLCPGTTVYMPPEALTTPPHYSSKLDCFSHGVLTLQIITRNFPAPSGAHQYIEDSKYPTGRVLVQFPETERRKNSISLIDPKHPLLHMALYCLKDRDTERSTAQELCQGLAVLKTEPCYRSSIEQAREQSSSLERLCQVLEEKDAMLNGCCAELNECQAQLQRERDALQELRERHTDGGVSEALQNGLRAIHVSDVPNNTLDQDLVSTTPPQLAWKQGNSAPESMSWIFGAAVVCGNDAYFSLYCDLYSYSASKDKWTKLNQCLHFHYSLAVINNNITAIGGATKGWVQKSTITNVLLIFSNSSSDEGSSWVEFLPPMPTKRALPAVLTTSSHLVVAGGRISQEVCNENGISTVEVLNTTTLQWFTAASLPQAMFSPQITYCGGCLFVSSDNIMYSCSVEWLLKSCMPASAEHAKCDVSIWNRLTDIPLVSKCGPGLATVRGHVLAIGGRNIPNDPTDIIHCYDRNKNLWSVIGSMQNPRSHFLSAVFPSGDVVVVGGREQDSNFCAIAEVGYLL